MRRIIIAASITSTIWAQQVPFPTAGSIERLDSALDQLIEPNAKIEVIASGLTWSEGPVWDKANARLLFSDVPNNVIHQWTEQDGLGVFMKPSGFTGPAEYSRESGSNGLTIDQKGNLLTCEHGDRRVSTLPLSGGGKMTLADRWDGKRFNSPNDLIAHPKGWVYFTDPPYGLPKQENDPSREIEQFGVYRINPDGKVDQVISNLKRPNGVTLSPNSQTLYVAQSYQAEAWLMSYPVDQEGNIGKGKILYDATPLTKKDKGLPDGLKTDQQGNIWCTGPGGVLVISPEGKLLGRILTGHLTANCCFGDDGSTLYMTADYYIMRIRTKAKGTGF